MEMDARVFTDLDALSGGALKELLHVMREAIQARGRFAMAPAGGSCGRIHRSPPAFELQVLGPAVEGRVAPPFPGFRGAPAEKQGT